MPIGQVLLVCIIRLVASLLADVLEENALMEGD